MKPDYRSAQAAEYRKLYKTKAWQQARYKQLSKQPLCELCSKRGIITVATVVNHTKPHKGDITLFHDSHNHQSLCSPCHNGPTQSSERTGKAITSIGLDGWPIAFPQDQRTVRQ